MSKKKLVLANNPLFSGPTYFDRDRVGIPYRVLPINSIDRDPNQPRREFNQEAIEELAQSIKTYGVLSPILVRPGKIAGRYDLITGERRFRATQLAGLGEIPAIIDQKDADGDGRTLAIQLVENLQRADLTPLERAQAIGALRDSHQLSVRDIGEKLGISKSKVQRSLEILELPDDLLNALKSGASESKVLMLSKIEDVEIRASYLKDLDTLTRNELEKGIKERVGGSSDDTPLTAEDKRIAEEIQRSLGLKVRMMRLASNPEAGRLAIDFYSNQDLQELFRKLVNE